MEIKKSTKADLDGKRMQGFLLGVILVLTMLFVALEYDWTASSSDYDFDALENIVKELDLALRERRADITVGISYGDSLTTGVETLKNLMMQNELIAKDPAPEVMVAELADSSVNLTLRFWVNTANYWPVFWSIKKALKPALESAGLNIPFPQRVVTFADPKAIPRDVK